MADYVPYDNGLSIEEFIDFIQNEITVGCALPKVLPDSEIRRIIETRALPYFYRWYKGVKTYFGKTLTNVQAGKYYLLLTDNNGCLKNDSVTIFEPAKLVPTVFYSAVAGEA